MRKLISLIALILSLVTVSGCASQTTTQTPTTQASTQAVCEEDQPCWDCVAMGNKMCGPDQSAQAWQAFQNSEYTKEVREAGHYNARYIGSPTTLPDDSVFGEHAVIGIQDGAVWHLFDITED